MPLCYLRNIKLLLTLMDLLRDVRTIIASGGIEERESRAIARILIEKVAGMDVVEALLTPADQPLIGKDGRDMRDCYMRVRDV